MITTATHTALLADLNARFPARWGACPMPPELGAWGYDSVSAHVAGLEFVVSRSTIGSPTAHVFVCERGKTPLWRSGAGSPDDLDGAMLRAAEWMEGRLFYRGGRAALTGLPTWFQRKDRTDGE
jgi:hypothetical protein